MTESLIVNADIPMTETRGKLVLEFYRNGKLEGERLVRNIEEEVEGQEASFSLLAKKKMVMPSFPTLEETEKEISIMEEFAEDLRLEKLPFGALNSFCASFAKTAIESEKGKGKADGRTVAISVGKRYTSILDWDSEGRVVNQLGFVRYGSIDALDWMFMFFQKHGQWDYADKVTAEAEIYRLMRRDYEGVRKEKEIVSQWALREFSFALFDKLEKETVAGLDLGYADTLAIVSDMPHALIQEAIRRNNDPYWINIFGEDSDDTGDERFISEAEQYGNVDIVSIDRKWMLSRLTEEDPYANVSEKAPGVTYAHLEENAKRNMRNIPSTHEKKNN